MVKVGKARVIGLLGEHYVSAEPVGIALEAIDLIEKTEPYESIVTYKNVRVHIHPLNSAPAFTNCSLFL